ncbi:Der1-like family-domain-containing protein [Lipomyces japonicus]|uniref:Der1-like family-domain-containing protein n=1 Tax=Lipomyces japonicus TaxID=56871 RepID=UPI0034CD558A
MSNEIVEFLYTVPPITRSILLGTIGTTFGTLLNIIPSSLLINHWPWTIQKLQIWRPVTAFLIAIGSDPMSKLMEIYMLYTYGKDLELIKFNGITSDYAYYLLVIGSVISSLNYFTGGVGYVAPLLVAFTYTWSQQNPNRIVSFYFGIEFKAKYLPAFLLSFKLLLEGQRSFLISLTGAAASYLYHHLESNGPNGRPSSWLQTPDWLKKLLPGAWSALTGRTTESRNASRGFGSAYYPRASTGSSSSSNVNPSNGDTTFRWGRGRRLGG